MQPNAKPSRKLTLSRETLRQLDQRHLADARGGQADLPPTWQARTQLQSCTCFTCYSCDGQTGCA